MIKHSIEKRSDSIFDKVDNKVKHWLMECFDLVEGEVYRELESDYIELATSSKRIIDATTVLYVSIPATVAPWYENVEFSTKIWDELKEKYVRIAEIDDQKVATVIVMDPGVGQ